VSTASAIAMLLTVAASTYLFRTGVILFVGNRPLPQQFERALQSVAPAVLSALVVTLVAGDAGVDGISLAEVLGLGSAAQQEPARRFDGGHDCFLAHGLGVRLGSLDVY